MGGIIVLTDRVLTDRGSRQGAGAAGAVPVPPSPAGARREIRAAAARIGRCLRRRMPGDVSRQLLGLAALAEGAGLGGVARIALDARLCLERGDDTAFAAVWARLVRAAGGAPPAPDSPAPDPPASAS